MKSTSPILSGLHFLAVVMLLIVSLLVSSAHGAVVGAGFFLVGSAAIVSPAMIPGGAICDVTLTPTILLTNTIRKIFVKVPALGFFSSEFTQERLKKGQTVTGKIRTRPVADEYDKAQGGYKNGSQEGRDLLRDITFVMDKHAHVTVSLSHLNAIQDSIIKMDEHMEDSASVLGHDVARYILGKIDSSAFANGTKYAVANSNKTMLNAVRKKMNKRGVYDRRFGLINTDVAETLSEDPRITNRYDDRSKDTDGNPFLTLNNLSGFQTIKEDPELGDGNTDALDITAEADDDIITTAEDHGYSVNQRVKVHTLTGGTGLTDGDYYYVQSVPAANQVKLSATRGGTAADITADATAGKIERAENISGFFGTREAIAIKTGLPSDSVELARSIGIPTPVSDSIVMDPDSKLSMICYKWFEPGTMDAYVTLACLYGAVAGDNCDEEGHVMGPSGEILRYD